MSIFDYESNSNEKIGVVESVDTANIIIKIENEEKLKKMQVNHLVVVQSSKVGQHLIALVNKIMRNSSLDAVDEENKPVYLRAWSMNFMPRTYPEKQGQPSK